MKYGKRLGVILCFTIPVVILLNNSSLWISTRFETPFKSGVAVRNGSNVRAENASVVKITMPVPEEHKQRMVVILAYMHTGSSFLGSILQQHKGAFYEYENLRSLMYSTHSGKVIYFLNGTERKLTPHPDKAYVHHNVDPHIGAEAVRNMVTCNHDKLDIATLANHYFGINYVQNLHLKDFFRCQEIEFGSSLNLKPRNAIQYVQNRMLTSTNNSKTIIKKCVPILVQRCRNASLTAEKFIRLTMEMASELLNDLPDVRIIHLVRDPRAMLDSQVRKGDSGANRPEVFPERARYMCEQMAADLKLAKKLKTIHTNRIHTIRYEDMVKSGMSVLEDMFNFIDIPLTAADRAYITLKSRSTTKSSSSNTNITNTGFKTRTLKAPIAAVKKRQPPVRPIRKYSKVHVSWREHLSKNYLDILDKHCSEVYEMLGYVKFKHSDLSDKQKEHYLPISLN